MGCGKEIEQTGADLAGSTLGFAVGGPIGAAAGAGLANAATGGNITSDLIAAGTAGIGSSADVGQALGLSGSIGSTAENAIGSAASDVLGGIGDSLGLTSTPTASTATTPGGATVNPSTGTAAAAPASTTVAAPATGGGTVAPSDIGTLENTQIGSNLGGGGTTLGTTGQTLTNPFSTPADLSGLTGTAGASANSALGAAGTDQIGSVAPATTAPAPTTATASPSSPSFLSQVESAGIKGALPLAGLAYSAIKGPQTLPPQATNLESGGAATAPLLSMEQSAANEAATGTLTPAQQADVQQYVQQSQDQLIQQLASQGVTDIKNDSRFIAGMQTINQQALALQNQYITQAINEATSAGGAASANIANVAGEQIQLDTNYQDALSQALQALGASLGGTTLKVA